MSTVRAILDPDTLPVLGRRWDLVTLGILAALLVFMPAAFGAVDAWSKLIVLAAAAALAICVAIRPVFDAEFHVARTWTYVPLGVFIVLVAFQLLPLPTGLASWLAPRAVATKAEFLGDDAQSTTTTLSFYPRATVDDLRMVLVGSVIFVTVASVFRRPKQIKELLLVIFVVGCAQAILSLSQIVTGAEQIYWFVPPGSGRVTSGSFVNYSHFCQFMNLSIGAGIALLLVQLREQNRHDLHGSWGRQTLARMNWEKHGLLICGIMLCAVAVFVSMSRNGAISLLVAAAFVGSALYRRGSLSWQGWLLGLLPLGVLMGLFLAGFDSIYGRLATLQDSSAYVSRWDMTAGTLRAWLAYPVWGTGLGTHRYVFPMFDTAVSPYLAEHADNDYAQLLEETGILGAVFVALFVIGMGKLAVTLAWRGRTPASSAAFGLGLGLIAVAIHSATDFGQRLPANFVLSATFCGLLVSISRIEARDRSARHGKLLATPASPPAVRRTTALAALVGVLAIGTWALTAAYADFLGERWFTGAVTMNNYIQEAPEQADDQDYADLLTAADAACQFDPANVAYGYWLNAYRWESLNYVRDPETKQMVLPSEALPHVARIADDLNQVRQLCPTYGPPYALEGQLRFFILGEAAGADLIRKGLRLAPYDPPTCLAAGELAVREGNLAEAESRLERAVELRSAYFREAIKIYLLDVQRPDLARKLAGDDHGRLRELADFCAQHPPYTELAKEVKTQSLDSLRRHTQTEAARPNELAALAHLDRQNGNLEASIELYRRALAQEYNRVEWRMGLAEALAADGQVDEAIHEAKICLRLRPQYGPAAALLDKLRTHAPTQ